MTHKPKELPVECPSSVAALRRVDKPRWEHFDHGADIGVRGIGPTLEAAFEQAAVALTAIITDPAKVVPEHAVEIFRNADHDNEILLVDWLNAVVYEMAEKRMLFSQFRVLITDGKLHGAAWGEAIDRRKHQPAVEIKGATYTELRLHEDANGIWTAQCVVDV